MRDKRFVAVHRGGSLEAEDHKALMGWALACTYHVLPRALAELDEVLAEALLVAQAWMEGKTTTGACITASRRAHAIARQTEDPLVRLLARCVGQAVATAHMADHCVGPAWYARKIVRLLGEDAESERSWQRDRLTTLPSHLENLVASARKFSM